MVNVEGKYFLFSALKSFSKVGAYPFQPKWEALEKRVMKVENERAESKVLRSHR